MQTHRPFHLAFSIADLEASRHFYGKILGCKEGRSTEHWVDFDFWGNQLSLHLGTFLESKTESQVAGKFVPMPHFGAVIAWEDFHHLVQVLADNEVEFIAEPEIRFEGEPGEQATFFIKDPSGNALEFKAFRDEKQVFAK